MCGGYSFSSKSGFIFSNPINNERSLNGPIHGIAVGLVWEQYRIACVNPISLNSYDGC